MAIEKKSVLKKFEEKLEKSPKLEGVLTVLKSLLNLSQIGSAFEVLISDYIPSRRTLRLESFVNNLALDFKKIEDRIDTEYITTDEFAYLFEQSFKAVSENYDLEKINAFKAIIINSSIDKTLIPLEKEFFLNLTKQLTVLHIKVLIFLSDPQEYLRQHNIPKESIQGMYKDFLPNIFPNIDFDTLKIVMDDLNTYGLTSLKSSSLGVLTVARGLQLLGDRKTTPFGIKYLKFISL